MKLRSHKYENGQDSFRRTMSTARFSSESTNFLNTNPYESPLKQANLLLTHEKLAHVQKPNGP